MSRLTRPNGNELSGIVSIVDMLVHDHRRHTDQITFLPRMLGAVVQIVTAAFDHQQKFLENVAVLTAPLARTRSPAPSSPSRALPLRSIG